VPKPLFKPPRHLVQEWPEIFEDLYMNTMPVAYLIMLRLEFTNGRIWEIDVQEQLSNSVPDEVAEKLLNIFQEYRNDIKKIDFQMDIERLKNDIQESSKNLL
jgi:hypothetical protein